MQNSTTQASVATSIRPTAAQVKARNLLPLYAYTPASFPYLLTKSETLTIIAVTMALAIPRHRKATPEIPQFAKDIRRDPCRKKATREVMMASPEKAIPMT